MKFSKKAKLKPTSLPYPEESAQKHQKKPREHEGSEAKQAPEFPEGEGLFS